MSGSIPTKRKLHQAGYGSRSVVRICQSRRSWSAPKWTVAVLTLMRINRHPQHVMGSRKGRCAGRPDSGNRGRLIRRVRRARNTLSRCTGLVAAACPQGKRTQHGKPQCVIRDDQPDAREGQAGRTGVAERPTVPLKPDNAGEGRGLSSRQTQDVVRDLEIGQPSNSEKRSETADGVTRES